MSLYYLSVFLTAALLTDLSSWAVMRYGPLKLYGMDLFNYAALALALVFVLTGGLRRLSRPGRLFVLFLAWLVFEVAVGWTRFSVRALGESRYVQPFFWFFVPLALSNLQDAQDSTEGGTFLMRTLALSVLAALTMFCIELVYGGRVFFTEENKALFGGYVDFRGVRYLDTYQTFNIMLAACALLIRRSFHKVTGRWDLVLAGLLILAALWTRNRAAVVALGSGLIMLAILERRFRLVFGAAAAGLIVVALVSLLSNTMADQVVTAFSSALHPAADDTGSWRLLIQLAGIEQGLHTPLLGQGYGGYFLFEIPGMEPILAPPHSQYIVLFMKGGFVAVILCIIALSSYGREFWRMRTAVALHDRERLVFRLLVLVLLALVSYGFAYDFPPLLGLFLGCGEVILQRHRHRVGDELSALSVARAVPAF